MGLMWDSFGWDMGFGSRMSVEFRPNCTGFVKNSQEKDYYSCIIYKGQGCLEKKLQGSRKMRLRLEPIIPFYVTRLITTRASAGSMAVRSDFNQMTREQRIYLN